MQVIAADTTTTLTDDQRAALRANAVARDPGNLAALLARANRSYRTGADANATENYLATLEHIANHADARSPSISMRTQFSRAVAFFNLASISTPGKRHDLLQKANKQMNTLTAELTTAKENTDLKPLAEEIGSAAQWVHAIIRHSLNEDHQPPTEQPRGPLARYERACYYVANQKWADALADLDIVQHTPGYKQWARQDPSLHDLQADVEETQGRVRARTFKTYFADPIPPGLLDTAPFTLAKTKLDDRGIRSLDDLATLSTGYLTSELGLTHHVAQRWRHIIELLEMLHNTTDKTDTTADNAIPMLALLRALDNIETLQQLRTALHTADDKLMQKKLFTASREMAVLAPKTSTIAKWRSTLTSDNNT